MARGAYAQALALAILAPGCLTDPVEPFSVQWTNEPEDGKLVPGELLRFTIRGASRDASVVLELARLVARPSGDGFGFADTKTRAVVCTNVVSQCMLPEALPAGRTLRWWIQTSNSLGIVSSNTFSFETPPLAWTISSPHSATQEYSSMGGIDWDIVGGTPTDEYVLLENGLDSYVCEGPPPCQTAESMRSQYSYAGRIVASDKRGLFVHHPLGTVRIASPPISAQAVHPGIGDEVAAGAVNLEWAPWTVKNDPSSTAITYAVQTSIGGTPWSLVEKGTATLHQINVAAGQQVYWRVKTTDSHGESAWSGFFTFRTPGAPPPAVPGSPEQGAIVPPRSVEFRWTPQMDAQHTVMARTNGEPWEPMCSGESSCKAPVLRAGQIYEWSVVTDAGFFGSSQTTSFTFETAGPIVFIHGFNSDGKIWNELAEPFFHDRGFEIVDFNQENNGIQSLTYLPHNGDGVMTVAKEQVAPAIRDAMKANGYEPDQRFTIVAHSMGGLVGRVIFYEDLASPYQLHRLVTMATPHIGCNVARWAGDPIPDALYDRWKEFLEQVRPHSAFLEGINSNGSPLEWRGIGNVGDVVITSRSATWGATHKKIMDLGHSDAPPDGGHSRYYRLQEPLRQVEKWLLDPVWPDLATLGREPQE